MERQRRDYEGAAARFGFQLPKGKWTGVEAHNGAELATLLGVDFDITVLRDSPYRTIADLDKPGVRFTAGFGTAQLDRARSCCRRCVNAWVRDLIDSGRMAKRLDYWVAQSVT